MLFEEKYTPYSKLTYKEEITIDYVLLLIQPFNRRDKKLGRAGGFIFLTFFLITDSLYQRYLLSCHSRVDFHFHY